MPAPIPYADMLETLGLTWDERAAVAATVANAARRHANLPADLEQLFRTIWEALPPAAKERHEAAFMADVDRADDPAHLRLGASIMIAETWERPAELGDVDYRWRALSAFMLWDRADRLDAGG